jgi:glycosyltransferase involved in cell wall biosynthesis
MTNPVTKIAIVAPKVYPVLRKSGSDTFGGAEVALSLVATELSKSDNFDVHVLVGDYGQDEFVRLGRITLVRALGSGSGLLGNAWRLLKCLHRVDARICLQRTLAVASAVLAVYCRLTGRKFVYWVAHDGETDGNHPLFGNPITSFLVRLMYRSAAHVIVQNSYEEERLSEMAPGIRCSLIKKGIVLPEQVVTDDSPIDGIWVGRCDEWKNPGAFIRLARDNPEFQFVMVCPPAEGKADYFKSVMGEASGCSNLEIRGRTANREVLELMSRSKVFCMTSSQEGDWPNVVLEAASLRRPVLSLAINYDGLLREYEGGRFCNGDYSVFSNEFNNLMKDEESRSRMGEGAYQYVRAVHDVHDQTNRLTAVLNGLAADVSR